LRCPECGAEVEDAAKFCLKCGQALTSPPPKKHSRVWQRPWWLLPLGIGMLLAAAVVLALLLWLKPPFFDGNGVEEASIEPSPAVDDSEEGAVPVGTTRMPTDTPVSERSTTEPATRSTATLSPTATWLPTATSPPTATPPPTEAVPEKQEYRVYIPMVTRHYSYSRR
jgi:hypothetical protein